MQAVTPELNTALAQAGLYPKTQIIMHLSNNRAYIPDVASDNTGNEDTIVDGRYETALKYAYTDVSLTDDWERLWPSETTEYVSVPWSSAAVSNGSGGFSSPCEIEITYPSTVICNKIIVVTDTYHLITSMTVDIKQGASYYNVVTNNNPGDLKAEYYLQSADGHTWSSTVNRTYTTTLNAIRLRINSISVANSKAYLMEFDAAIEADVSDDVLSWNVRKERDLSAISLSPIGSSAANSADISLDNSTNKYNNDNIAGLYKNLLLPDTRFDIYMGFKKADLTYEYVRQGVFYTDSITMSNDTSTVSINLRDGSKALQDKLCPPLFYIDTLIQDIVRDVVERAGIVDYEIDASIFELTDLVDGDIADYTEIETLICVPKELTIWSEENQTYWQFLQEIAFADMAVFYFDESGKFIFKVKETFTDESRPEMRPVKTLSSTDYLKGVASSTELLKNFFTLEYSVPKVGKKPVGLWEADTPTILDAAALAVTIDADDVTIPSSDIQFWQKEGYFKIDNEIIRYEGRGANEFKKCKRGWLNTTPVGHASSATIYEVRKFEIDFNVSPASDFSYWLTNEAYFEILSMSFTPVGAEIYVLNNYNGKAILDGAYVDEALDGLSEVFIITGKAIEQGESQTIEQKDEFSIKKFGKKDFSMTLKWVQSESQAQNILDYLVAMYSNAIIFLDCETFALPQMQLGDTVQLSWPRLGLSGRNFHVVSMGIGQSGADVTQTLRLRSKAGEASLPGNRYLVSNLVASVLKQTISGKTVGHRIDSYIRSKSRVSTVVSLIAKPSISLHTTVDSLISKNTVYSMVDAYIPNKSRAMSMVNTHLKRSMAKYFVLQSNIHGNSYVLSSIDSMVGRFLLASGIDLFVLMRGYPFSSVDALSHKVKTAVASVDAINGRFVTVSSVDSLLS